MNMNWRLDSAPPDDRHFFSYCITRQGKGEGLMIVRVSSELTLTELAFNPHHHGMEMFIGDNKK
jgi:hypothetical protein